MNIKQRSGTLSLSLHHVRTRKKAVHKQARKRTLPSNFILPDLGLGHLASRTVRKLNFCCLRHSTCGILLCSLGDYDIIQHHSMIKNSKWSMNRRKHHKFNKEFLWEKYISYSYVMVKYRTLSFLKLVIIEVCPISTILSFIVLEILIIAIKEKKKSIHIGRENLRLHYWQALGCIHRKS